jgi:hypothetical protein
VKNSVEVICRERVEGDDAASGQEWGDNMKRRVFSSGSNKSEQTAFHMGKKRILLAFVEAMYFINKKNGFGSELVVLAGFINYLPDFLDSAEDGREKNEPCVGGLRKYAGKGSLASARRSPQEKGREIASLKEFLEYFAWGKKMLLADKVLNLLRPHFFSQWPGVLGSVMHDIV